MAYNGTFQYWNQPAIWYCPMIKQLCYFDSSLESCKYEHVLVNWGGSPSDPKT